MSLRAIRSGPAPLAELAEHTAALAAAAWGRPLEELPEIEGWLARVGGLIRLRYAREARPEPPATSGERLLTVQEAAARLSKKPDWLYHHHRDLPFAVKVGGHLRFQEAGLNSWIRELKPPGPATRRGRGSAPTDRRALRRSLTSEIKRL